MEEWFKMQKAFWNCAVARSTMCTFGARTSFGTNYNKTDENQSQSVKSKAKVSGIVTVLHKHHKYNKIISVLYKLHKYYRIISLHLF